MKHASLTVGAQRTPTAVVQDRAFARLLLLVGSPLLALARGSSVIERSQKQVQRAQRSRRGRTRLAMNLPKIHVVLDFVRSSAM